MVRCENIDLSLNMLPKTSKSIESSNAYFHIHQILDGESNAPLDSPISIQFDSYEALMKLKVFSSSFSSSVKCFCTCLHTYLLACVSDSKRPLVFFSRQQKQLFIGGMTVFSNGPRWIDWVLNVSSVG